MGIGQTQRGAGAPVGLASAPPPAIAATGQPAAKAPSSEAALQSVESQKKPPPESPAVAAPLAPASAAASGAGAFDPGAVSTGPLKVDQLAQFVAEGVDDLRQTSAAAPAGPSGAGQHVVRELDVELAPAGLGAVSVKMRLSNGKLSIVMEVSNAHALRAVQGEQAAIAASLGSSAQPLDSLVIRQSETSQNQGDKGDAPSSNHATGEDAQSQSDRAPRQGQFSDRREPRAAPTPLAPRRRADGLLV